MTDIPAQRPLRDHAFYCMAKAALEMATKSLALELAPHVRVNAIAPGAILWPEDDSGDERRAALLARTPLARTGTPEAVAEAVSWLLRDATYCTGKELRPAGGGMLASDGGWQGVGRGTGVCVRVDMCGRRIITK